VVEGNFSASILIHSDDAAQPVALVSLLGQGLPEVLPPQLLSSDSSLSFDQIPPGATTAATLTLSNTIGVGPLQIQGFDTVGLPPEFSLAADTCSGSTLLAGLNCTLQVRFAPNQAGLFTGSFQVLSNDLVSPHQIDVQGFSNTPPSAALLKSPADGSTGLPTSLTLTWIQQPDVEGDSVSNTVQIATDPLFFNPLEIPVVGVFGSGSGLLLGGCGFAALLLPLGLRSRKLRLTMLTLGIAIGLLILVSCGGGGGGGATDPNLRSQKVSGLASGTTYYWRVLSDDGQGGMSQSEEFTFITQ
jgi:HYDIN/CFA65/VesB-like, Ig-like domain